MTVPYELADCPACGAAEAREVADAGAVREQVERLWAFHLRRLRPGTPLHRLTDRVVFSQRPPVRVVECIGCGTVYRDPRERERTLLELYAGESPEPATLDALFTAQHAFYRGPARRLTRVLGRAGRGLEIGSYVGAFLAAAGEEGWDFEGLDVSPSANAFARGRGFRVTTGSAEDLPDAASGAHPYDAVTLWNCFDQLPDPRATLAQVRDRLAPGGVLALRVPNGGLYASLAGHPAGTWVLAMNNLLGFPYRHGFTPRSLALLATDAGFDVRHVRSDTLVPVADAWTRPWARWEERAGKAALRAFLPRRLMPWFELYATAVR